MKQIIECRSREEMMKMADRMIDLGYSVKTAGRLIPFQPYGICVPSHKVIFWDKDREKEREDGLSFMERLLRRTTWKSDLRTTSAFSESSAL